MFGLLGKRSVLTAGVDLPCILAVGLPLSLTSGFLVRFDLDHPPAASTTLIVSMGLLSSPAELAVLMLAASLSSQLRPS